jgi:hypothetical protein
MEGRAIVHETFTPYRLITELFIAERFRWLAKGWWNLGGAPHGATKATTWTDLEGTFHILWEGGINA